MAPFRDAVFLLAFVLALAGASVDLYDYGLENGDDVACPTDDTSYGPLNLMSDGVPFGAKVYNRIFVTSNGLIVFEGPFSSFTPEPFPFFMSGSGGMYSSSHVSSYYSSYYGSPNDYSSESGYPGDHYGSPYSSNYNPSDSSAYNGYNGGAYDSSSHHSYYYGPYGSSYYSSNYSPSDSSAYNGYNGGAYDSSSYHSYYYGPYGSSYYSSYNSGAYDSSSYHSSYYGPYDSSSYNSYNGGAYDSSSYHSYYHGPYDSSSYNSYNGGAYDGWSSNGYSGDSYGGYGPEEEMCYYYQGADGHLVFSHKTHHYPYSSSSWHSSSSQSSSSSSYDCGYTDYLPGCQPHSHEYDQADALIAAFWTDSDLTVGDGGKLYYRLTNDSELLDRAAGEVFAGTGDIFYPTNALVATWENVQEYATCHNKENTFQAVLVWDSTTAYVIMKYDKLEWSYGQVGFNTGDYFCELPGSRTDAIKEAQFQSNIGDQGTFIFGLSENTVYATECYLNVSGYDMTYSSDHSSHGYPSYSSHYSHGTTIPHSYYSQSSIYYDPSSMFYHSSNPGYYPSYSSYYSYSTPTPPSYYYQGSIHYDSSSMFYHSSNPGYDPSSSSMFYYSSNPGYDPSSMADFYSSDMHSYYSGGSYHSYDYITSPPYHSPSYCSYCSYSHHPSYVSYACKNHQHAIAEFYPYGPEFGDVEACKYDTVTTLNAYLPIAMPYGSSRYSTVYISSTGVISFERGVTSFNPQKFPLVSSQFESSWQSYGTGYSHATQFYPDSSSNYYSDSSSYANYHSSSSYNDYFSSTFMGMCFYYLDGNGNYTLPYPMNHHHYYGPDCDIVDQGINSHYCHYGAYHDDRLAEDMIAVLWEDSDIRLGKAKMSLRETSDPDILQRVSNEVRNATGNDFWYASSAVIATWEGLHHYEFCDEGTASFQAILATDGNSTYIEMKYHQVDWPSAQVGFNTKDVGLYCNLPGSQTAEIAEVTRQSNGASPGTWIFGLTWDTYSADQCNMDVVEYPTESSSEYESSSYSSSIPSASWVPCLEHSSSWSPSYSSHGSGWNEYSNLFEYGLSFGDRLACPVDDHSYGPFELDINGITVGSKLYQKIFVSSNGLITFGGPHTSYDPEPFPFNMGSASSYYSNEYSPGTGPYSSYSGYSDDTDGYYGGPYDSSSYSHPYGPYSDSSSYGGTYDSSSYSHPYGPYSDSSYYGGPYDSSSYSSPPTGWSNSYYPGSSYNYGPYSSYGPSYSYGPYSSHGSSYEDMCYYYNDHNGRPVFSHRTYHYPYSSSYWHSSSYHSQSYWHPSSYHSQSYWHPSSYQSQSYWHPSSYHSQSYWHPSSYQSQSYWHPSSYHSQSYWHPSSYQSQSYWHPSSYQSHSWYPSSSHSSSDCNHVDYLPGCEQHYSGNHDHVGAVIAAFWTDIDPRIDGGKLYYRLTNDSNILYRAWSEISDTTGNMFYPTNALVVTWEDVQEYSKCNGLENTFQAVVVWDSTNAYVIMIYDKINWGSPQVGVDTGDFYCELEGSRTNAIKAIRSQSNTASGTLGTWIFGLSESTTECHLDTSGYDMYSSSHHSSHGYPSYSSYYSHGTAIPPSYYSHGSSYYDPSSVFYHSSSPTHYPSYSSYYSYATTPPHSYYSHGSIYYDSSSMHHSYSYPGYYPSSDYYSSDIPSYSYGPGSYYYSSQYHYSSPSHCSYCSNNHHSSYYSVPCKNHQHAIANFYPYGPEFGDMEACKYDDITSLSLYLPHPYRYGNLHYHNLYMTSLGILSFEKSVRSYTPHAFPLKSGGHGSSSYDGSDYSSSSYSSGSSMAHECYYFPDENGNYTLTSPMESSAHHQNISENPDYVCDFTKQHINSHYCHYGDSYNADYLTEDMIAVLWADTDMRRGNARMYLRETTDPDILLRVSHEVKNSTGAEFHPYSAVVATWEDIYDYESCDNKTASFQAVLASDGHFTFVVMKYDNINLPSAQVGFNTRDESLYCDLPGSRTPDIIEVLFQTNGVTSGTWTFGLNWETYSSEQCQMMVTEYPNDSSSTNEMDESSIGFYNGKWLPCKDYSSSYSDWSSYDSSYGYSDWSYSGPSYSSYDASPYGSHSYSSDWSYSESSYSSYDASPYGSYSYSSDWSYSEPSYSSYDASPYGSYSYSSDWSYSGPSYSSYDASPYGSHSYSSDWSYSEPSYSSYDSSSYGSYSYSSDWSYSGPSYSSYDASPYGSHSYSSDWSYSGPSYSSYDASPYGSHSYSSDWSYSGPSYSSYDASPYGSHSYSSDWSYSGPSYSSYDASPYGSHSYSSDWSYSGPSYSSYDASPYGSHSYSSDWSYSEPSYSSYDASPYGSHSYSSDWSYSESSYSSYDSSSYGSYSYSSDWSYSGPSYSSYDASPYGSHSYSSDWSYSGPSYSSYDASPYGSHSYSSDWSYSGPSYSSYDASPYGSHSYSSDWSYSGPSYSSYDASPYGSHSYSSDWSYSESSYSSYDSSSYGSHSYPSDWSYSGPSYSSYDSSSYVSYHHSSDWSYSGSSSHYSSYSSYDGSWSPYSSDSSSYGSWSPSSSDSSSYGSWSPYSSDSSSYGSWSPSSSDSSSYGSWSPYSSDSSSYGSWSPSSSDSSSYGSWSSQSTGGTSGSNLGFSTTTTETTTTKTTTTDNAWNLPTTQGNTASRGIQSPISIIISMITIMLFIYN